MLKGERGKGSGGRRRKQREERVEESKKWELQEDEKEYGRGKEKFRNY